MIFFFQAEDGIRAGHVTGVQTCALPICHLKIRFVGRDGPDFSFCARELPQIETGQEIGRASCRERGEDLGGGSVLQKKQKRITRPTSASSTPSRPHRPLSPLSAQS